MTLDLLHPAAPLERFGACVGMPPASWVDEGFDVLTARPGTEVAAGALAACSEPLVELARAYGDALRIDETRWSRIKGLSGAPEEDLELRPDLATDDVASFLEAVQRELPDKDALPGLPLSLVLRLNKRRLIERHLRGLPVTIRPALFLDPQALAAHLRADPARIEGWWDKESPQRLVLFAPSWRHFLVGPLLAVVGGDPEAGLARLLASGPPMPAPDPRSDG